MNDESGESNWRDQCVVDGEKQGVDYGDEGEACWMK